MIRDYFSSSVAKGTHTAGSQSGRKLNWTPLIAHSEVNSRLIKDLQVKSVRA